MIIAGLTNDDSSVGISATRPEDYDVFILSRTKIYWIISKRNRWRKLNYGLRRNS